MHNMMKEAEQVHVKSSRLTGATGIGFSAISRPAGDRDACAHDVAYVLRSRSTHSNGRRAWRYPEHGTRRETYEPRSGELETQLLDGSACRTKKLNPRAHVEKPFPMYPMAARTTRTTSCMRSCSRDSEPTI